MSILWICWMGRKLHSSCATKK